MGSTCSKTQKALDPSKMPDAARPHAAKAVVAAGDKASAAASNAAPNAAKSHVEKGVKAGASTVADKLHSDTKEDAPPNAAPPAQQAASRNDQQRAPAPAAAQDQQEQQEQEEKSPEGGADADVDIGDIGLDMSVGGDASVPPPPSTASAAPAANGDGDAQPSDDAVPTGPGAGAGGGGGGGLLAAATSAVESTAREVSAETEAPATTSSPAKNAVSPPPLPHSSVRAVAEQVAGEAVEAALRKSPSSAGQDESSSPAAGTAAVPAPKPVIPKLNLAAAAAKGSADDGDTRQATTAPRGAPTEDLGSTMRSIASSSSTGSATRAEAREHAKQLEREAAQQLQAIRDHSKPSGKVPSHIIPSSKKPTEFTEGEINRLKDRAAAVEKAAIAKEHLRSLGEQHQTSTSVPSHVVAPAARGPTEKELERRRLKEEAEKKAKEAAAAVKAIATTGHKP